MFYNCMVCNCQYNVYYLFCPIDTFIKTSPATPRPEIMQWTDYNLNHDLLKEWLSTSEEKLDLLL